MSTSIHEAAGYKPEPELDETMTDLAFRIIFIHGLSSPCTNDAGRYDKSEAVGLKPIKSPFELPQTTAYTFYHGDNLLDNVNNIPEAAKALCTALGDEGTETSYNTSNNLSRKRTIIVCHGSGGFIAKEALLRSLEGSDHYQAFHPLILGIIFIGTPHSTTDERLPYQLNFMRHSQTHSPQVINMETVTAVKSLLQTCNRILWSRLGFMPVSFFEELNSPGTPEMFGPIVNSEDVHIEGQRQIGLHADHWNTWNFSDPLSSAYRAVSTVIHSFCHGPQNMTSEAAFQPMDPDISGLLRSLQVNNTEFLSSAMKGTCSWIFENHTFESWLEQPSGLLWVKGKPGSGKSTLLRYIHQTLKFRKPTSLLFFQFNYSSHTSINTMLRSLIFQLLVASPSYQLFSMRDTYATRTETHGDYGTNWQWGDNELLSYLQDSFLRATQDNTHIVVIIDAVDEVSEKLSFNSVILDILSIPSIRICASSRLNPKFPGLDAHTITLEDLNTADIIHYAKSRVLSVECNISSVQGDLIQSLIKASDGMFLYIDLVLSNLEIWLDQQEGRLSYNDFPRSLMDLYSLILAHIESSKKSRDFFQHTSKWVAFATRPLTVPELTNALAFEKVQGYKPCTHMRETRRETPSGYRRSRCECSRDITSLSRGLIAVQFPLTSPRQPVVCFTHQSVSQFLMSYEPFALKPYNFSPEGHEALASSCCKIILSETLSRRIGYTNLHSENWELTSYALESWIPHLRKALQLGSSCSDLLSDLSQNAFLESFLALNESMALNYKELRRLTHKHTIDRPWQAKLLNGSSPLHLVCVVGHVDSCERYISLGESYNDRDCLYGITPLGWASAYGHVEVVDFLLSHGATVDYTSNGTSPLDLAIRCGNKRVVERLLSKGSITKQLPVATQPALSLAASLGRASIVDILVSYGANALTADEFGWSPLQHAIAAGKKATLARLLSTIPKTSFERLRDLPPRSLPGWVQRILLAFGLGLCCRGSGSCSSSTNTGPIDSRKSGKRGRQGSKKRGRDTTEDMDESDQQSMAPPPQKQSRHTFELRFACPYNKRCPNRFGGACSNFGFPDMHRLKEHLFRRHFLGCDNKTRCGRCKSILPESEIQDHLILTVACEPLRVAMNYEDGFDTNQSDTLKSLKPKQFETPVHHWEKTFNTVFPDWVTDLPSPYHETTETECRVRVAARLRSEEFRQEVWRNPSNMGREIFEQLANLLDPWPRASTRPGNQTPTLPEELPIRPGVIQERASTELNPSIDVSLPMEPQRGTTSSDALASEPVLNSSAQVYRPIPPHFLFPQQVSDTLSLSLFSGTGSLNSFGPGHESMYGDTDANDASMSSWDCSFANAQMGQTSNDPLGFTLNAPTPASIPNSSRSENQLNRNPDIAFSGDTQPAEYEDATNTFWTPSRKAN